MASSNMFQNFLLLPFSFLKLISLFRKDLYYIAQLITYMGANLFVLVYGAMVAYWATFYLFCCSLFVTSILERN